MTAPGETTFRNFLSEEDGALWYAYVNNNPVNAVDPLGLEVMYYDTTDTMSDRRWNQTPYGINPIVGTTVGNVGCDLVATNNIANAVSDTSQNPGELASNAQFIFEGQTFHNRILRSVIGDESASFESITGKPERLNQALIDLELSDSKFYVKAIATIEYGPANDRHNSRHVVQIVNVTVIDTSDFRAFGIEVSEIALITVEGTSINDRNRTYSLWTEDRASNVFKITEIKYYEDANED